METTNNVVAPTEIKKTERKVILPSLTMTQPELEAHIEQELKNSDNFQPNIPVQDAIGKLGLMWPNTYATKYQAAPLLSAYAHQGCPVDCGPNWTKPHIIEILKRGPHQSAKSKGAASQLRAETQEKIYNSYARIVKWSDISTNIPPKLKISPVAMIPHKSRAFRYILDLSFKLHKQGISYPSVN